MAQALQMQSQQSNGTHRGGVNSNDHLNKTVSTLYLFITFKLIYSATCWSKPKPNSDQKAFKLKKKKKIQE